LAVEDDSAAKKIVAAKHAQITEISESEYEDLKKKPSPPSPSFQDSPLPSQASTPQVRVAGGPHTASSKKPAAPPAPAPVVLKSAKLDVPDELKEVAPTPKPKPKPQAPKSPAKAPLKSPPKKSPTKVSPKKK
jgi:hypothetical protein